MGVVGRSWVRVSSKIPWHFESCRPSISGMLLTKVRTPRSEIPRHRVRSRCLSFLGGTIGLPVRKSISLSLPSISTARDSSVRLSQFIKTRRSRLLLRNSSCIKSTSSQPLTSPARMSFKLGHASTTFCNPCVLTLLHQEMFKCSSLGQLAAMMRMAEFVAPASPERLICTSLLFA